MYGWLSPEGQFIVSGFGKHYLVSLWIIDDDAHNWALEEAKWCASHPGTDCSDFLIEVKHYVLIDNVPQVNDDREMFVSYAGELTAEQKAFLNECREKTGIVFHKNPR